MLGAELSVFSVCNKVSWYLCAFQTHESDHHSGGSGRFFIVFWLLHKEDKMAAEIKQCRILVIFANNTGLSVLAFAFVYYWSYCFVLSPLQLSTSVNLSSNDLLMRHIKRCFPPIIQGNIPDLYTDTLRIFNITCKLKLNNC